MGFMRKALFVSTGGLSGAAGIKANSKKERIAKASEKQLRLQQQVVHVQAVAAPQVIPQVALPPLGPGEVEVRLIHHGDKKIQVIKVVRAATGWSLKDAKEWVGGRSAHRLVVDAARGKTLSDAMQSAGATVNVATEKTEPEGAPEATPESSGTLSVELGQLAALHESGVLSAEEFAAAKKRALGI